MATSYLAKKKAAATPKNEPLKPTALPAPKVPAPSAAEDAQQEYERFFPAAKALEASSLRPFLTRVVARGF